MKLWTEDDFAVIRRRAKRFAGQDSGSCMLHASGTSVGCWCLSSLDDGGNANCPPKRDDPPPPDMPDFHFEQMPIPWSGRR